MPPFHIYTSMITQFTEHALFPITVYENNIPVDQEEFGVVKSMPFERMPSDNGFYTENKDILVLLPNTRKQIEEHISYYVHTVLQIQNNRYKFPIQKSWVNKHTQGDEAHTHFHANSLISGVYYLSAPPNSGDIAFHRHTNHNNFLSDTFAFETNKVNERNTHKYKITPKDGTLLLFPSHVRHAVEINNTWEVRYSLAFNVWVRGEFGNLEIEKLKV